MAAFTESRGSHLFSEFNIPFSRYLRILYASCVCFLVVSSIANGEVKRPRGVSLSNEPFYSNPESFTCLDGSAKIDRSRLNDDYCDCKDGSDEPGTSACPNGRFHCSNKGYKPKYIPSSRVNDGICDCCDASDEFKGNGAATCHNTCRELGKEETERRKKEIEMMNQGYEIRQEYVKQGKDKQGEREETLRRLKGERDEAMQVKADKEVLKNAAEAPERDAKDAHKAVWEAELGVKKEREDLETANRAFVELDTDHDSFVSFFEIQTHIEFDSDANGEISSEEAQAILGGVEQVDLATFITQIWPTIKDKFKFAPVEEPPTDQQPTGSPPAPIPDTPPFEDEDDYDEHMPADDDDYDDDEDDYDEDEDDREYLREQRYKHRKETTKEETKLEDEMPPYNQETQALIEVADQARKEFDEASSRFSDLEKLIEDIEKQLAVDLGPEQEFQAIQEQCFEMKDREYTYKLCPFDRSVQSKSGAETSLGKWDNWDGPDDNKYSRMRYTKGRNCWNGPDRSTTVLLKCGLENRLYSATEPEKCTYQFEFETPALCLTKTDVNAHEHTEL
ncbi:glucosidase 2 subunit beta-like [Amphiura filiformis]|uniref:glucosidase 2 subunit beta-like n=1 Tax=Amphiura filiformis TaxID=82378 RepID=UPI003B222247